ncbi:Structure-specific endonuclease subunit slx1 [Lecanosticta acicola]|uniref:Structure-specific endonuclease subunit slx1 n=1 Tax=Lecanosticta acicola TaxID=111012 RepID=A0AAI9E965_9PEZI|nr:Structure-specific endonuclease subunit slx1 [Lecanosticta acicola]
MEKQIAPIPAFYACYLLRSIARHSSLYVGSTPNPPRRLRQHNGDTKGGAVRTSRDSLRPWEMTCLVTGFSSKIAALQFEWAWQNPNLTRHIAPDLRITQSRMTVRISPRTGKTRKRSARPRLSLTDRLANLHLLLRSKSFERWPLKLTFFSEDVFRVWQKWTQQHSEQLRPGIEVVMDESSRALLAVAQSDNSSLPASALGINALDLGYSSLKLQLMRSQTTFNEESAPACAICHEPTSSTGAGALLCAAESCTTVTHLQCLASVFLKSEQALPGVLVPTGGNCPGCGAKSQWVDLVKELSLRMRGEKEMKALFKPKRGKKAAAATANAVEESESGEGDDPMDMVLQDEDDWHRLSDDSDDEVPSKEIRSDPSPGHGSAIFKRGTKSKPTNFSEPVIEDSDWDEAELLT